MVVILRTLVFVLAAGAAVGQEAQVRAWVDNPEQRYNRPFRLHLQIRGEHFSIPELPQISGIRISKKRPKQSQTIGFAGGRTTRVLKLSYEATPTRRGSITIPPIPVMVDGDMLQTKPIKLVVKGANRLQAAQNASVRVWTDTTNVVVGRPFWIYVEASGRHVELPGIIYSDGLRVDPANVQNSSSFSFGSGGARQTMKKGFYATALNPGTLTIPPLEFYVEGRTVRSEPYVIIVEEQPAPAQGGGPKPANSTELTKDDLIFIETLVDKHEVYQGEPILMRKRLWRIIYRGIDSGTWRGADIRPPSTEGFYAAELPAVSTEERRGAWRYEVTEESLLLYPTATGDLRIGPWHWEGMARVPTSRSLLFRDEFHYELDTLPIDIEVKPLPSRTEGFSGAVGDFTLAASLSQSSILQGVPVKLTLTIRGHGNPDAVGEPVFEKMDWAHVGLPETSVETRVEPGSRDLSVAKEYVYTLTPLEAGPLVLPEVKFIYFDPVKEEFVTERAGPFDVMVMPSAEGERRLVIAEGINLEEGAIDILGEDIRPIMGRRGTLGVERSSPLTAPVVSLTPMLCYGVLAGFMARRRRFDQDSGFRRSYHAKARALKGLREAAGRRDPIDRVYRTLTAFMGDSFDVDETGLTSADVDNLLRDRDVDETSRSNVAKILRACERARYASQTLSSHEIRALIEAAEEIVDTLKTGRRKKVGA